MEGGGGGCQEKRKRKKEEKKKRKHLSVTTLVTQVRASVFKGENDSFVRRRIVSK